MYGCSNSYSCQVCFSFLLNQLNKIRQKDRRSWLLKQLLPRSLLDQFSLKQLITRVRHHLQNDNHNMNQLSVARKFMKIFSENTRSFAGKLFPVKFPVSVKFEIFIQ